MPTHSVLFVCLGNICRSPLAEGVFRHLVSEEREGDDYLIDSAGTGGWHVGEAADPRSRSVARAHGLELTSRARKLVPEDLERFDWVIAMDRQNLRDIKAVATTVDAPAQIHLMRDFEEGGAGKDVPDPYYGGPEGFERMYELIHEACLGLLAAIRSR